MNQTLVKFDDLKIGDTFTWKQDGFTDLICTKISEEKYRTTRGSIISAISPTMNRCFIEEPEKDQRLFQWLSK